MPSTPGPAADPDARPTPAPNEVGGRYSKYALGVLMLVYVFNFVDRQIISVLADEIKRDLGITDAQVGFLYGTAFAVFYAVFGIPLGRLADVWVRKKLISIGLSFWSLMTALSGTANSFVTLGAYRIGVGVGEASASPAAFSMLSDYFSPERRATALSIYSSGVYIGAGIGIFLGGWIVEGWRNAFPDGNSLLGLAGWQAAYIAVGLPGLLMALWVWSLREPIRGQSEGIVSEAHPDPFGEFRRELFAVLPPFTLWSLAATGAGARGIALNLAGAAGVALLATALSAWTGSTAQWVALGIGLYAALSWAQGLKLRDPPAYAMILKSRALLFGLLGFSSMGFVTYGLGFWMPPLFYRVYGVSEGEVGTFLGLSFAIGGWLGVTGGGLISDMLKRWTHSARLLVAMGAIVLSIPLAFGILATDHLYTAYALNFAFAVSSSCWAGSAAATANELVLPRMRAMSSAFYILLITFVGLALGPYTIGQISDSLTAAGATEGAALRVAMRWGILPFASAMVLLLLATRYVGPEERSRIERARAAGEPGL